MSALPAVPDPADPAEIVDGVIVEDDDQAAQGPRSATLRVLGPVATMARDKRVQGAGRHAAYIVLGVGVGARRAWNSRTSAPYQRWLRSAEAAGDHDRLMEYEARLAAYRRDRHQRRMDWAQTPAHVAAAIPKVIGALALLLLTIGCLLGVATQHISAVGSPFVTAAKVVQVLVEVGAALWLPVMAVIPVTLLVLAWVAGRRHAHATSTGWLAVGKAGAAEIGVIVTADTIVVALQNLPNPALRKAFKDGWQPKFHLQPIRDGLGYAAIFEVPLGVTPEMIADQRKVFARNMHRAEVEVWPADAERAKLGPAGSVSLWVADKGAMSRAVPEYPLMHEGETDVFAGVPAGVSTRGDALILPVMANNFVAGGQMGMGKSNACRVVIVGAALDPIAELWVHVFASNGDFDAFAPRLARYVRGLDDEHMEAAMASLREMYAEVGRREARLAELGAKKVTRQLAIAHPDLRPRLVLFSECHELFGHREFGDEAADLAVKTIKRARKTGMWMGFDTQSSRKAAIPPALVELVSVNACFYVKNYRSNDGFLGDGSFASGIRATELRPSDRGTSLITGVSDNLFELLRWYFIEVDDDSGFDAAADIIARAAAAAAPAAVAARPGPAAIEDRDVLADVAEVTGHDRVKVADLPARLRELAPYHRDYRAMTGAQLRELLEDEGVRVTNTGNVPRLDPADLAAVLASRAGVS